MDRKGARAHLPPRGRGGRPPCWAWAAAAPPQGKASARPRACRGRPGPLPPQSCPARPRVEADRAREMWPGQAPALRSQERRVIGPRAHCDTGFHRGLCPLPSPLPPIQTLFRRPDFDHDSGAGLSPSWLNSHNATVKSLTPSPLKADSRPLFPQIKFQNHWRPAQSESAGAAGARGAARPVAGLGALVQTEWAGPGVHGQLSCSAPPQPACVPVPLSRRPSYWL